MDNQNKPQLLDRQSLHEALELLAQKLLGAAIVPGRTRLQTQAVTVSTSATSGTQTVTLDSQYENCIGFAVYAENSEAASKFLRVAISNQNNVKVNATYYKALTASGQENPNNQFLTVFFPAAGTQTTIEWSTTTAPGSAWTFDVVFLLQNPA